MYDHTLHRGRNRFCRCFLQAFSTEEILKRHIKDSFKTNDKQKIIMPKNGEYIRLKNYEKKIKSPFMVDADFESILVPSDCNGTRTHNQLVHKRTLNHLAKLAK